MLGSQTTRKSEKGARERHTEPPAKKLCRTSLFGANRCKWWGRAPATLLLEDESVAPTDGGNEATGVGGQATIIMLKARR